MTSLRTLGWIPVLLAVSLSTAGAADRCKLLMTRPVPVRMQGLQPVIYASVNGIDAPFAIDTGSFFGFLSPGAAAQFRLPLSYAPPGFYVTGVGGSSVLPQIATVKSFKVAGLSVQNAIFLVGVNDFENGVAGILGQNLFRISDVDFDFADGVVRFVKPQHCGGHILAYWATTQQPLGIVNLHWTPQPQSSAIASASVNGHSIDVLFDSGSWRTILSLDAAKRAGITPDSPGVIPAGETIGIGDKVVRVWVAPIAKFEIGGETIEHTHVLIGEIDMHDTDMLLGADFFLAHHIYIAYSQDKLYFTYNGGPVFDLNARRPAPSATASANTPVTAAQPGAAPAAGAVTGQIVVSDVPTDAAGFMRRGMAEASRGDFAPAITDLTHACELEPADADCRYQRGIAYWRDNQPQPALADFGAAIQRRPDDFDAYLARAQLEMAKRPEGFESDLDAVDRLAPQQADLRLLLARLYTAAGEYAGAVHQYDLWVEYHPNDVRLSGALSSRCGSEAAANVDLDRAVDDCNSAARLERKSGAVDAVAVTLSNRALVYLREDRLDDAFADLETALKQHSQSPRARYELGLVELRKGLIAQGQADLAAAQTQHPGLAERFASIGLKP